MAWLDDNPPVRSQFRRPRRAQVSGVVVVHTAENTPDFVAFDGGAEAVANFIRNRSDAGSYHELCDSDSSINLVGWDAEAFHDGTGSNPHSFGVSAATRADVWPLAPEAWRSGCIANMAERCAAYARWVQEQRGILIPPRRITREQSEARIPGFISHAERDPERRTDPGAWFPWDQFLDEYARRINPQPETEEGDDDMTYLLRNAEANEVFLVAQGGVTELGPSAVKDYIDAGFRLVTVRSGNHAKKVLEDADRPRRIEMYLLALGQIEAREEQRDLASD